MGKIDDPLDQAAAQNPPPEPGGAIAAALNVAGLLLALIPAAVPLSAAAQLFAFGKQFHDSSREDARAEAFRSGLCEAIGDVSGHVAEIERRLAGPDAEEAVVVAVQRASNSARLDRAREFGMIIGGTAAQESPDWQEAAQFIRDLEQFTDRDIRALKILWRVQHSAYTVKEGAQRAMATGADHHNRTWKDVIERASGRGFTLDDWYAQCARLSGFGLPLQVQPNASFVGPDDVCYRLTGRAVRLLTLLGVKTYPYPYPSVRYHPVHGTKTVNDEDEDKALGPGWVDTPKKFGENTSA